MATRQAREKKMGVTELLQEIKEKTGLIRAHEMQLRQTMRWQANFSKVELLIDKAHEIINSQPNAGRGSMEMYGERMALAQAAPVSEKEAEGFLYSKYFQLSRIETELFHILDRGKICGF